MTFPLALLLFWAVSAGLIAYLGSKPMTTVNLWSVIFLATSVAATGLFALTALTIYLITIGFTALLPLVVP